MRSLVAAALLAGALSCGARQPLSDPVAPPVPTPRSVASALIEFSEPADTGAAIRAESLAAAESPRGSDRVIEALSVALRSRSVREPASAEVGSEIESSDVEVERSGARVRLVVRGDSSESSVARCLAILRATDRRLRDPDASAGITLLREQAQRVREELAPLQESLRNTPPHLALSSHEEPAESVRARAGELLRLQGETADPHTPLPDDAPGTLRAAAAAYLEAELAVAQLTTRYGPSAVPLLEARERLRVLASQFTARRRVEVDHARALIAELDRQPGAVAHAVERARATVLLARLAETLGSDPVVPDDAPLDLRILADEVARARIQERVLALRYGARAPQMITAQVRVETLLERFEERRRENVALLRARLAALETAPRGVRARGLTSTSAGADGRVAREQQLRETLFILVDRIDQERTRTAMQPPPFRVMNACAVSGEVPEPFTPVHESPSPL